MFSGDRRSCSGWNSDNYLADERQSTQLLRLLLLRRFLRRPFPVWPPKRKGNTTKKPPPDVRIFFNTQQKKKAPTSAIAPSHSSDPQLSLRPHRNRTFAVSLSLFFFPSISFFLLLNWKTERKNKRGRGKGESGKNGYKLTLDSDTLSHTRRPPPL